ncbi:MAG: hypothetical protein ACREJ9_18630 [Candidatus Rokuibacteriota bacterium]
MLYRAMDRAALDAAYNNTAAVGLAKREQYVGGWTARSDTLRKARGGRIDLRYGDGARQRLDLFACGTPGAPTLVYIHGGYWQMNDKEPYAFLGEGLLPAAFNLALLEYTLGAGGTARPDRHRGAEGSRLGDRARQGAGRRPRPRVRSGTLRGRAPDGHGDERRSRRRRHRHKRHGLRGRYLPLAGHDHFSILEELAQPEGAILGALKELDRSLRRRA